jgi:putative tryptophan/tyrosine transport system substrate-binding protein
MPGHRHHARKGPPLVALAVALLSGCASAGGASTAGGPHAKKTYRIGVLQVAAGNVLDDTVGAFEQRLRERVAPRKVTFELKNAQGDQSLITSIARDFAGSGDDAFAVIGTPAVIALATQVRDRPIFALAMGDPVGGKVAKSLDRPGGNVTGSIDYVDPALVLDQIMKISPAPKRLGTVYDPSNQNMRVWVAALRKAAPARGLSLAESTISGPGDVPAGIRGLVGRADTVLIGPDATVFAGEAAVGSTAAARHIPVYLCGGDAGTSGILASVGPDYRAIGRLAAEAAAKVLGGAQAGSVPFGRPGAVGFQLNEKTVSALGVVVPKDLLAPAAGR